jgi:hypothetical protein
VQCTKKVKHTGRIHRATVAGIAVLIIGLLLFSAALFLKLRGTPDGWPVVAMVAGAGSIGLAGLSLIVGLLVERQLPENGSPDEGPTTDR